MAIMYQGKKVTAAVKAKHELSDFVIEWFDRVVVCPETIVSDWGKMTTKEQNEFERHAGLLEGKHHKVTGVKFKEIISRTNYKKSI